VAFHWKFDLSFFFFSALGVFLPLSLSNEKRGPPSVLASSMMGRLFFRAAFPPLIFFAVMTCDLGVPFGLLPCTDSFFSFSTGLFVVCHLEGSF